MNDSTSQNSTQVLQQVSDGDMVAHVVNGDVVIKTNKIKNEVLRLLVKEYLAAGLDKEVIINLILAFDEAAEKNLVDDEFFKKVAEDKDFLNKIITNGRTTDTNTTKSNR